ncbi:MAG: GGDEF domain-containing protein [Pseudomonadota bacterium]
MDRDDTNNRETDETPESEEIDFDCRVSPTELAQRALSLMEERKLPPLPSHYELFYTYFGARNEMLNHELDRLLDRRLPPKLSDLDEVHQRHFVDELRMKDLRHDLFVGLEDEVSSMIDIVGSYLDTNKGYSGDLSDSISQIDQAAKPQSIRETVQMLLQENRKMRLETEQMTERLEQSRSEMRDVRNSLVEAQEKILTDPLTGLGNRRKLDQILPHEIERALAKETVLCVAMADIDHFKRINDTFGHPVGDAVLEFFGGVIKRNVKGRDEAVRYGGEEFAIILPQTGLTPAQGLMDKIREELKSSQFTVNKSGESLGKITVSLGVALLRRGDTADSLIARADANLYRAKTEGRDRVIAG